MAKKLNHILLTFLFISITLNSPATTVSQTVCPYPCYPTPTGPGNVPPATPPPPSQTGSYPPPAFNPPPTGFLPDYPPPPYYVRGGAPPPPDPMVPWFPYYYRKPPHGTDQYTSSTALHRSTAVIGTTHLLVFLYFLLFSLS